MILAEHTGEDEAADSAGDLASQVVACRKTAGNTLMDQVNRGVIEASTALAAEAPWFIDQVDSPDVGEHVAVVIRPKTGATFVSYYCR